MRPNDDGGNGGFQRFGLVLAAAFYLVSIIVVCRHSPGKTPLAPAIRTITFAHWQLEDGFREGYDEAIRQFEACKAGRGEKVKVIQVAVPFLGYHQWFQTQLIGGAPADVIELIGSSEQQNQYFVPLSAYVGQPNPFNQGTPFAKIPWKDTYHDNMNSALNPNFGEYYGVGMSSAVYRLYVNLDLLEKATGRRTLPVTLAEWLADCEKIRAYGKASGQPLIPIGVRGFDKATLYYLFIYYFSQMNSGLNDNLSENCSPWAGNHEILALASRDQAVKDRLLAAVEVVKQIGRYFGEGFVTTDLEQTKSLFFTGRVTFFPEGTWNAYSMVKNSPFEVAIGVIPAIDGDGPYAKYYVGRPSEQGLGVGGLFGIPKTSKNFDLALEFLQFTTSWKINQMIMVDYCKWLPAVKKAEYRGLLQFCQPLIGTARTIFPPFQYGSSSQRKMLESLETLIVNDEKDPTRFFWEKFGERMPLMNDECRERIVATQRTLLSVEKARSTIALEELRSNLSAADKKRRDRQEAIMLESLLANYRNLDCLRQDIAVLEKLRRPTEGP